jgi:hypothetical protein
MITLNTERGFERIESWTDIEGLPGYHKDIDPKAVKLSSIIGSYRFSDHVTCGLSTCHHKHFRGYVVTTSDGWVTNIGKDCGRTHFGVDFETLSRTFDRELMDSDRRVALGAAKSRLSIYLQQIDELKSAERGATWLNKQIKLLRQSENGLPHNICRRLDEMLRTQSAALKRARRATKAEIEVMRATGRLKEDDHRTEVLVEDDVGILSGLAVLKVENDIRELLILDLGDTVDRLHAIDIAAATSHELGQLTKRVAEIEPKLDQCRRIVALGVQFFDRENLSQFAEVAETNDEERQIMAFARRY